ncbi:MAG: BtpA/SgcQ family protein, partial [Acidilobaceae archaeon]
PLHEESDITNIVRDCVERCGYPIYSIILTGSRTGEEPGYDTVEKVIGVVRELGVQLYVGSGVTHTNISKYWSIADGFIVGTSIKVGGRTENPISEDRAIALAKLVKHYRSTIGC